MVQDKQAENLFEQSPLDSNLVNQSLLESETQNDESLLSNESVVERMEVAAINPSETTNNLVSDEQQSISKQPANQINNQSSELLPQQILQHKQVAIIGQWDIEKWECWLREADISPATLNLAQHGIMQGEIGQKCQFIISPEHRLMATELMDGLHQALKIEWPSCEVELTFKLVDDPLPLQLKANRHEQALTQADHLLRQEPTIKSLISQFDASLLNVALKD